MCRLVLQETGLLPHANGGALTSDELAALRPVSASQGMMIESVNPDLDCHRNAPDKVPARRLATLDAAGELAIPFTTGILVGIGDTRADRIAGLEAIAASHRRYGHVQEVIVQNFLPKPATGMRNAPACPSDEYLWTIAAARVILPAGVHLQAPPNLSDDFARLLDAGIDDWGGVSPVTADHVNPERPWPALDRLRAVTEGRGFELAPRLTIYPEYAADPERWLDPALRFPVLDRSDAESLARDDPGAHFPERVSGTRDAGDGADVILVGDRSTAWYSGSPAHPPVLVPGVAAPIRGAVAEVLDGVRLGHEPGVGELVTLFGARGREVAAIAELADELRRETVGDAVTWVHNRNINYTNVCTFKCRFCGFAKGKLSLNLRGTPYLLTLDDIADRAREAWDLGATEVTLQGGIHPSFDGDYYIDVTRAVKAAVPGMHVHGFTALEVTEGAKRLGEPLEQYLLRLKDAGLGTLPGTAAEILDDEVRAILCPDKVNTEEWLYAHETAHGVGLRSNVTIMFGSVEQPVHWARHLVRTRELQRRTGGFTEFVPLPFVHMASPIYLQHRARRGPTFRETVLMHAVGRIAYRRADRQHPGLVGEDRRRRLPAVAARRRQRPRRHADEREHQPRRRRRARPGHGAERLRRRRGPARPPPRPTQHHLHRAHPRPPLTRMGAVPAGIRVSSRPSRPLGRGTCRKPGRNAPIHLVAWAARRWVITAVTFSAVGRWRYSLGPWALLPGPSAPVTTNWAPGNCSPSMPMNGIVPPSPNARAG